MMAANDSVSRSESSLAAASATFAAILLAIVVPLLLDFGYGILDAEVWFWGGIACCLAVVLGWGERLSLLFGAVCLAVLSYVVVDLYFAQSDVLNLGILASFLTASLLSSHTSFRILSVVFCLIFVATSLIPMEVNLFQSIAGSARRVDQSSTSPKATQLPPIVHIILDEFASLSRMPDFLPLRILNQEIETDYLKRGFAVYRSTRSTSGSSAIALSELVGPPGQRYYSENELASKKKGSIFQVPNNFYFKTLKQRGYRISVVQSSHLDFCGGQASHCLTYRRAEFIDAALRYAKPLSQRLPAAGSLIHARASAMSDDRRVTLYSYVVQGLNHIGIPGKVPRADRDEKIWSPAGNSLRVFDHLRSNFVTPKPGDAYFVHLLLPHFPFILDRNCKMNSPEKWRWPLWAHESATAGRALDDIYAAFSEQLRCTHSRAIRLIDAMMKSQFGSQAIFIIHGDHGARIHSKIQNLDKANATEAFLTDGLDAFFAVKAPAIPAGIDEQQELLQVRFQNFINRMLSR